MSRLFFLGLVLGLVSVVGAVEVGGVVYEDMNGNGRFDSGEVGVADVGVSNGRDVVATDGAGRYRLEVGDGDADVFVIKPSGWRTALDGDNLPRFSYLHRPGGTGLALGSGATGGWPGSVDFPLYRQAEPADFEVVLFGDTQPGRLEHVEYMVRDVVEDLIVEGWGERGAFGMTLGDVVGNAPEVYEELNAGIGQLGLAWYNVPGNHDSNAGDRGYEVFKRVYGRDYYAFNYARAHFVVLNDVLWFPGEEKDHYRPGLGAEQVEFVRNDLALVPAEKLVVVTMHVPLVANWQQGKAELLELLAGREHVVTFAGHIHRQQGHFWLGAEDGWRGERPLHHVMHMTACGPWWQGLEDEFGLPAAVMGDGTPNGFGILSIRGNEYTHRYKAARRPESYQMHIVEADGWAYANVYSAWPGAAVRMRVGGGAWRAMERSEEMDPMYLAYRAACEEIEGCRTVAPLECRHLWKAPLAEGAVGLIEVEAANPDGQVFRGARVKMEAYEK